MAGRKKKKSRRRTDRAVAVERLTEQDYIRAWDLFAAGMSPNQICKIVGLTARQLNALYHDGFSKGKTRLVGFKQRLAEEQAAIRAEAVEAGKTISSVGVEVLSRAMRNANTAQVLIESIFRLMADRMEYQASLPVERRAPLSSLMPDDETLKAIRVLDKVGKGHKEAATSYRLIYDDPVAVHPATRSALDLVGKSSKGGQVAGAGQKSLPAALAFLDELAGDGAADAVMQEMARDILRWTPEQRDHYASTGEEPDPKDIPDVIDVTTN